MAVPGGPPLRRTRTATTTPWPSRRGRRPLGRCPPGQDSAPSDLRSSNDFRPPEGPTREAPVGIPGLAGYHVDRVIAAGTGGVWGRLPGRLELAAAVGGPDLEGAAPRGA